MDREILEEPLKDAKVNYATYIEVNINISIQIEKPIPITVTGTR